MLLLVRIGRGRACIETKQQVLEKRGHRENHAIARGKNKQPRLAVLDMREPRRARATLLVGGRNLSRDGEHASRASGVGWRVWWRAKHFHTSCPPTATHIEICCIGDTVGWANDGGTTRHDDAQRRVWVTSNEKLRQAMAMDRARWAEPEASFTRRVLGKGGPAKEVVHGPSVHDNLN